MDKEPDKKERLKRNLDLFALTELRFAACGFNPTPHAVKLCLLSVQQGICDHVGKTLEAVTEDQLWKFVKAGRDATKAKEDTKGTAESRSLAEDVTQATQGILPKLKGVGSD